MLQSIPQKKYYSNDRKNYIIFDLSIEVYRPGAAQYSMLMLIECKNNDRPVPVDAIEEFYSKIAQVSGANVKGIVASTSSFQSGAKNYAQSKGIGLLRYYDRNQFQWVLERSPSAAIRSTGLAATSLVGCGLLQEEYQSGYFDFFCQSNYRFTNSLWEFFDDFVVESDISQEDISIISNRKLQPTQRVSFIYKDDIESTANSALINISYNTGKVDLSEICHYESIRSGLSVVERLYWR